MKRIILLLLSAVLSVNAAMSQTYNAHDVSKLRVFLLQKGVPPFGSPPTPLTNGEYLGLTAAEIANLTATDSWAANISGLTWTATTPKQIAVINWEGADWRGKLSGHLDLSGCTALTELDCEKNALTSFDVSGCTALTFLDCHYNELTSLNVSGCAAMTYLTCALNQLSVLDLTGCRSVTALEGYSNPWTTLNFTGCDALIRFNCDNYKLSEFTNMTVSWTVPLPHRILETGGYSSYQAFYLADVSNATLHVPVGTVDLYKNAEGWKDFGDIVEVGSVSESYHAHDLSKLRAFLIQPSATAGVTNGECLGLTSSEVSSLDASESWVSKLAGVTWTKSSPRRIMELTGPWSGSPLSGVLDLSDCESLSSLSCHNNQLTSLNISGCGLLSYLDCRYNQLTSLSISGCTSLTRLICESNHQLTSLDLSSCVLLTELRCQVNKLSVLDLRGNTLLSILDCSGNQLSTLDLRYNTSLTELNCHSNPLIDMTVTTHIDSNSDGIPEITLPSDLSSATLHVPFGQVPMYRASPGWREFGNIVEIGAVSESYHAHDLSKLRSFLIQPSSEVGKSNGEILGLSKSDMSTLPVSDSWVSKVAGLTWSEGVPCRLVKIEWGDKYGVLSGHLDVSGCAYLFRLDIGWNAVSGLDVSGCVQLEVLRCQSNRISTLDVSGNTLLVSLVCSMNELTDLDLRSNLGLTHLEIAGDTWLGVTVGWQSPPASLIVSISPMPAATLYVPVGASVNYRGRHPWTAFGSIVEVGGELLRYDAHDLYQICLFLSLPSSVVGKLNGELLGLSKSDMSSWTTNDDWVIKLAGVTWDDSSPCRIKKIEWDGCGLGGYLDVSGLSGLEVLECAENGLVGIDISGTPSLVELWCYSNPLRDITVDWSIPKSTSALGSSRDEWLLRHITYVATATLHVPSGTLGLYRSAEGWRLFYSITEDAYVANTNVARPSVSVFVDANTLTINSPASEVITLYSLTGVTLLQQAKDEGITTINLSRFPKGVILVSGSSGWVRKVLR